MFARTHAHNFLGANETPFHPNLVQARRYIGSYEMPIKIRPSFRQSRT